MSIANFLEEERQAYRRQLVKTATATLTLRELQEHKIIMGTHASVAIALTLPAAAEAMDGMVRIIGCGGAAAVTVVVTAGYGAVGAGGDTITLAQGECVAIMCDGTNWYAGTLTTDRLEA